MENLLYKGSSIDFVSILCNNFQFQSPQTCNIEPHTIEIVSCDNDDCTVVSTDVTHSINDDGSFMVTAHLSLNANKRYSIRANITYETGESFTTNAVNISKYIHCLRQ